MILSSHIIVASALSASLINQPFSFLNSALIFILSFLSHFLLDMIPHWDYKVNFIDNLKKTGSFFGDKERKFFKFDLVKLLFDGILGIVLSFFIIENFSWQNLIGLSLAIFGAILPDALTVFYFLNKSRTFPYNIDSVGKQDTLGKVRDKNSFLGFLYNFHGAIHGRRVFNEKSFWGAILQILTIGAIILLIKLFF
ncbi:hypothetical protein HZB04_01330 [Candidatus Wolfebacteria bacterium]|nr:hypothetical protein [Candidatus Wolfebacteria bacterium]